MTAQPLCPQHAGSKSMAAASLIAAMMCVLPFLLPHHALPLPSFQAEWLAFALGVASAGLALMGAARGKPATASLPGMSQILFALGVFVAIQGTLHPAPYTSIPVLGVLYLAFAAVMIWLGAQLSRTFGQEQALGLLARSLLLGALITALLAFVQYLGRPAWLGDLVAGQASDRAYGNIAQPNLFSNYIAVGEAALIFLWVRRGISTPAAAAAAVMLAGAGALSGTRSTLLFAAWFALMGIAAGVCRTHPACKRAMLAGIGMAFVMLASSFLAHWAGTLFPSAGSLARTLDGVSLQGEPRWQAWRLALGIFFEHPLMGAGWGAFSGAAFAAGIAPEMTRYGEVWTSAHNMILQLLSETGLIGAAIMLPGLANWAWRTGRRWLANADPALGWVIAVVGVELAHSMVEFPLWSAHFLGFTALVMGAGTATTPTAASASRMGARFTIEGLLPSNSPPSRALSVILRWPLMLVIQVIACMTLSIALALALRDYILLESTRFTGTTLTLAASEQVTRDAGTMQSLAQGIFAPVAEVQIFARRRPEEPADSAALGMSERVMRFWPSHAVAVRRAILLAQSGRSAEANVLIVAVDRAFPLQCNATRLALERARAVNPHAVDELRAALSNAAGASPTCS